MRSYCAALAGVILILTAAPAMAGPVPGDSIQPFSLPATDSRSFEWQPGKVTVISFCAFWCDTWKEQSKRMSEVRGSLAGLPVDLLTISIDGRWSRVAQGKIDGIVLLDSGRRLSDRLEIDRIPYTIVVDDSGKVTFARQGIARSADVIQAVRAALDTSKPTHDGSFYITFDDFPSKDEDLDDELLDVLRVEGVQATFFCICSRLAASKDIVRRAIGEGHSLQIHCWEHQSSNVDLEKCAKAIRAVGREPTLYRPTGKPDCYKLGGDRVPFGFLNPYDFERPGTQEITRRVMLAIKPGSIVLLHAGVNQTIDALLEIIVKAKKLGLQPEVLR